MSPRLLTTLFLIALGMGGIAWIVAQGQLPPADFTFNNGTDIKSFDPAVVTGQPEGRLIDALYEGLVTLGPQNREPLPGVAKSWEVSDDGLTYTFHLRKNATWTNGDPVTADDFVFSMRRFLDPNTLAEYAYQAWYLKNARRYSKATRGIDVGDLVEVELHERPEGARPFARGKIVLGELKAIEIEEGISEEDLANPELYSKYRIFVIETQGNERRFHVAEEGTSFDNAETCKQLLLDFGEVGFRAVDKWTVETVLESPTPFWIQLIGFYPLSPVNRRCVETYGSDWPRQETIVTNGPYRLVFHRLRDRIRIEKRDDYWDADSVSIQTIDALAIESLTTGFNLYETGKIDWVPKLSPVISRELIKIDPPRNDFNPAAQFGTYFYSFNVTRKPLDDVRVRRALVMAIDRQEILETACAGEIAARSFTPPGLPDYDAPLGPKPNLEEARRLLAEAGYPDGAGFPKIDLLYNFQEEHQTIAELLRKQWRNGLGINVSTRNEEWTTYLSSQRQMKFDAVRRAWIGDYLDPNTFLDLFVTNGENNKTGWSNNEYDELIKGAQLEVDPQKRLALLRQAEVILLHEAPIMPVYFYVARCLVRPHVRGFWNNLQDTHPLRFLRIDHNSPGPNEFMATAPQYTQPVEELGAGEDSP